MRRTTTSSGEAIRLPPGVVTGAGYQALVAHAKAGGFALPAVNVTGTNTVNAVLEAAAANASDVIIQLSHGGAQFFGGPGLTDAATARVLGAVSAAQHVHLLAEQYGVCVILHTDHASRSLIPWVEALVLHSERHFQRTGKPLYSSHMLDLSAEPLDWNIAESARILERVTKIGTSLEIELGVTGGEEDGIGADFDDRADNSRLYTQPADVLRAYDALATIGQFSIAASFGNVHGVYTPGNVKLRPEILRESQHLVASTHALQEPNPLNLVFHGGSGSDKQQIAEAVGYGVFKFNIDTDMQFAFSAPIGKFVEENLRAFTHQVDPDNGKPYKSLYDPRKLLRQGEKGMVARLAATFRDLGSVGKSIAANCDVSELHEPATSV